MPGSRSTLNLTAGNGIEFNGLGANGVAVNGLNLNGLELNGMRLNGMRLNGMRLNGMRLNGIELNGMRLNGMRLNGMRLNGMRLNGMRLNGMRLNGMRLNGMRLNGVVLTAEEQDVARKAFGLMVRCAVPSGTTVAMTDFNDTTALSFPGEVGLDPGWAAGMPNLWKWGEMASCVQARAPEVGLTAEFEPVDLEAFKMVLRYLAECALPEPAGSCGSEEAAASDPGCVSYLDETDAVQYLGGALGLAPAWKMGTPDVNGQELTSACLMARVNGQGMHVTVSIRSPEIAHTPAEVAYYNHHEGGFMGNLFADAPWAKVCRGRDGIWTAGRECTIDGRCGFDHIGDCTAKCAISDAANGSDDCSSAAGTHRNVVNTFMYSRADFESVLPPLYPAGNGPLSAAVADLNGDRRADLVTANRESNDVSVLLGLGDGAFAAQVRFPAGTAPQSVAVADFNGDGRADLVTANHLSNDVSVLLGRGDGSFAPQVRFPAGSGPDSVAVADFNGDGRADLVTANWYGDDVSVLLGAGDGSFAPQVRFPAGGYSYPDSVAVADFNGDSRADLVTANYFGNDVSVLLGRGDGTFAPQLRFPAGYAPQSVAAADFNGDGRADLVTANYRDDVSVLLGQGNGTFAPQVRFPVGGVPKSVAVADFNGDHRADLVTTNLLGYVGLLLGRGDGTFAPQAPFLAGPSPSSVAVADFNGDGRADFVTANYDSDDLSVLLGAGDGSFAPRSWFLAGPYPWSVAVADFNGDRRADVVTANSGSSDVTVLLGAGDGTFAPQARFAAGVNPVSVAVADFNGDGRADLITANLLDNDVSVLLGRGDGTFAPQLRFPIGRRPESVAVADFNGDGQADLVTANSGDNDVGVLLGRGDGTLAPQLRFPVGVRPRSVAVTDFNGDGRTDLVTANYLDNDLSVLLGRGDGTFAPQVRFPSGGRPSSVAVADFNGDGRADLVTANSGSNDVSVLLGRGDGAFAPQVGFMAPGASSVAVADMNGDTWPDVAIANTMDSRATVLLGDGTGTFSMGVRPFVGAGQSAVATADLNGDRVLDLVMTVRITTTDGYVTVLRGRVPAETCNGVDDDRDGVVDNGFDVGAPCLAGAGIGGVKICSADGTGTACHEVPPALEVCNGRDDDGDGQVDEGNPGGGAGCDTGRLGTCAAGILQCYSGNITCQQSKQPTSESCNGLDDNCDGVPDDGFTQGIPCDGPDSDQCDEGVTVCSADGMGVVCNDSSGDTVEVCNGLDDDCDGTPDQTFDVGAACSVGVGGCRASGQKVCSANGTATECSAVTFEPGVEICGNGIDDDCDGEVDEGFDVGAACSTGVGACQASGQRVCSADGSGTTCNAVAGTPHAELCGNAIDDDCDGQVDEGFDVGAACAAGVGACQAAGQKVCSADRSGTLCNAVPGVPGTELCGNGIDDNCNGQVDEGFDVGIACSAGVGACLVSGQKVCSADRLATTCNAVAGTPQGERCGNGVDDDCDGQTDEGFDVGTACSAGVGACQVAGQKVCSADASSTVCNAVPGTPGTERCGNAIDDDCNGQTDEGFALGVACDGPDTDLCKEGVTVCSADGTGVTCNDATGNNTEACNGVDDDCEGQVDQGLNDTIASCLVTIQAGGGTFRGTTAGMRNDYTASCGSKANSPDVIYAFTLTSSATFHADTIGSAYNAVLQIKKRSNHGDVGSNVTCNDDGAGSQQARIDTTLAAGSYFLVVDGYGSSSSGAFTLNVRW